MKCKDCIHFCSFTPKKEFNSLEDSAWCDHPHGSNDPAEWDDACEYFELDTEEDW